MISRNTPLCYARHSPSEGLSLAEPLILCVDDDPVHLQLQQGLLESSGYAVIACADAHRALEVFGQMPLALVVLDYSMPRMNGGELAAIMHLEKPDVPLLMLSGQPERPTNVGNAVKMYMRKGDGGGLLVKTIQNLLRPAAFNPTAASKGG